jgi:hypothetical protein
MATFFVNALGSVEVELAKFSNNCVQIQIDRSLRFEEDGKLELITRNNTMYIITSI